jgi:hypothetical protein
MKNNFTARKYLQGRWKISSQWGKNFNAGNNFSEGKNNLTVGKNNLNAGWVTAMQKEKWLHCMEKITSLSTVRGKIKAVRRNFTAGKYIEHKSVLCNHCLLLNERKPCIDTVCFLKAVLWSQFQDNKFYSWITFVKEREVIYRLSNYEMPEKQNRLK